ncbi:MAG: SMP-30/gluconolactonase/LRE family protein [Rhizobiaceae bacterium]|nr:SMP-30/gluconolactonase/LRE family protein [Rhizobiaceae bacterium]
MSEYTTTILSNEACQLGEGATYDARTDTAWWFDITESLLFEHSFADDRTVRHPLPFMASQLSFLEDGRQLVASETGLHLRDPSNGELKLLQAIEQQNPVTRSNDGRVHPSGALWIGTMGKALEPRAGAIYWYRGGTLRQLFPGITIPNAICFAADGTRAFFTDTANGRIMTVETETATGLPIGDPTVFNDSQGEVGGVDGAVLDAEGLIWNARWGAGRIDVYNPAGDRVRSVEVGVRQPSCPAFVGRHADRMIVTSARRGLDHSVVAGEPQNGKTLLLEGRFKGRHDPFVVIA